jgi:transcription termination/antitermination protein NusA
MQLNNLVETIDEICHEKGLSKESVLEAIEKALATAYRKDFGVKNQNIQVKLDLVTGQMEVFDLKTVVEDLPEEVEVEEDDEDRRGRREEEKVEEEDGKRHFNPKKEITISEAKKNKKKIKIGDEIRTDLPVPSDFGRVAAQSAKQVIIQKLREAERGVLLEEYKGKEDKILSGIIQRKEHGNLLVDLGKITAIIPYNEQVENENYQSGQRIKIYIVAVRETNRGPEIIASRAHPNFLREIFKSEIPEVANGIVEIKAIAREAGSRTKVAVVANEKGVDPIGTCIGQRGSRIQTIIAEIGGEKIDIVEYSDSPAKFIISALSPAKVASVKIIDEENKIAKVKVKPDQLSLAIGRSGQNVRLAAKLTGWRIEVDRDEDEHQEETVAKMVEAEVKPQEEKEEKSVTSEEKKSEEKSEEKTKAKGKKKKK